MAMTFSGLLEVDLATICDDIQSLLLV